ncbi:MAG: thiamine pyrophosphate-binding protein [Chitinispirillaceae bacterium]|nr:thiamine pyrophosphate-binding protein [Chitinispirillaceae bacterium]
MELKVSETIIKCLEAEDIKYAFGISGSHYLSFFNAIKNSSITFISVKHESSAGFMAAHYARIAQKPALILGTAGPGAMNLLNGIAEIYKANLPCFILTPIVATDLQGKNAFQEDSGLGNSYPIAGIMKVLTKKTITCVHPQNIALYVRDLLRIGLTGRKGPVHLLVPTNFFELTVDFSPVLPVQYRNINEEQVEPIKVRKIAKTLHDSKRPLFFVGNRAWYPDISDQLQKISFDFGIPVILSGAAKGLYDEYSPYFGGILDLYGHRSAEVFAKKSDCVISIGEDFGENATIKFDPDLFADNLIHLDIDGYDIGRNYTVKLSSCGSLTTTIEYLHEELRLLKTGRFFEENFSEEFMKENEALWQDMQDSSLPLKSARIFKEISDSLPKESIVINDIGISSFLCLRHLRVPAHCYSSYMTGYSMGQGVSGVIGAKCAAFGKIAIAVCGDGALLMNGMEIVTSSQYQIPIIWIVIRDNRYGMVDFSQKILYNDLDFCTTLQMPDVSQLAASFGIDYFKASDIPSLRNGFLSAIKNYGKNKSALIEVIVDPDDNIPLKPRAVKFIQDFGNANIAAKSPYLMKAFKRMLREKV